MRRRERSRRLSTAILALFGLLAIGSSLYAQDDRAVVMLTINQVAQGTIMVRFREGDILVELADLERVELRNFSGRREAIEGEIYVSLASLKPGIVYEWDEQTVALRITAQPSFLKETILELRPARPRDITYSRETSTFLNYSVGAQDRERVSLFTETGFSYRGNLASSTFSRDSDGRFRRGDTSFTLDNRDRMRRAVVGDSFGSTGDLGASFQLAGISLSRNFGLDPYFNRQPAPTFTGAATVPSQLEVYINDTLVRRQQLSPGTFELRNLPVTAGKGQVRLLLRDAFGRVEEIQTSYYFASQVLGRDISEYNYHLGLLRNRVSGGGSTYGPLVFAGQHRYGVSESLTAGFRLEAASRVVSGGPNGAFRLRIGEMSWAGAVSSARGGSGGAGSVTYSYLAHPIGLSGSLRLNSGRYSTLNLTPLEDRPLLQASAAASVAIGMRARFSFENTVSNLRDGDTEHRISLLSSIRLANQAGLIVSWSHTGLASRASGHEVLIGLNYSIGGNRSVNVTHQEIAGRRVTSSELQQTLPIGTGLGYRIRANAGGQGSVGGQVQYNGDYGRYEAELSRVADRVSRSVRVSGGVVAIGGGVHLTRPVQDSYALIRLPGVANVRGYVSNQQVGRTNSRGELLIPNMLSYYGNSVRIRADDLPFNYSIAGAEKLVAPTFRGGAVVEFPIQRMQSLTGIIVVEAAGQKIVPANGQLTVTIVGKPPMESPLGMEGEFYLENLPEGPHSATIEYADGVCRFMLEAPASDQPFLDLGTLICSVP